ncbi:MAG: sulfatase [Opitutaceae bacterium]|nr:sulfatase [Opitutaceae bacterium]
MTRILNLLVALALTTLTVRGAETGTAGARWNILFVFADDLGRYAGAYAKIDGRPGLNAVVQTPHIDRIAREGTLFRNAFANSPSCTPSRSALLSGRYFFNTGLGAILRGAVWDPSIPSFPLLLRDAGYHIGKSYKVWGPGTPADAPFGGQQYAYERAGKEPNHFSESMRQRLAKGETADGARAAVLSQIRGNFDDFLRDRPDGKPWLYFLGVTTTHRPWVKGSGQQLWNLDPEQLKGKLPAFLPDVPEVREDVADYLGEVQAVDAYVGTLLERLEQTGELERTLIVVSGDHGIPGFPQGKCNLYDFGTAVTLAVRVPGGTKGRVVDDFVSLPDLAPTFLDLARVPVPTGLYGRSLLSLLTSSRQGQVDETRTWVIVGRERHVDVAREGALPYPMRALRTGDFLYIRNFEPDRAPMGDPVSALSPAALSSGEVARNNRIGFMDMDAGPTKVWLIQHREDFFGRPFYEATFGRRPLEELYDLRQDSDQTRNVAQEPAYADVRAGMEKRLLAHLRDAGDPRVIATPSAFDRPPFTSLARGKSKD